MKKLLIIITVILGLALLSTPSECLAKKKGVVSKVKDAAAYGFGWQLGKEGAKAAINKGKEIANDPKTKSKVKEIKEKTKEKANEIKNKTK